MKNLLSIITPLILILFISTTDITAYDTYDDLKQPALSEEDERCTIESFKSCKEDFPHDTERLKSCRYEKLDECIEYFDCVIQAVKSCSGTALDCILGELNICLKGYGSIEVKERDETEYYWSHRSYSDKLWGSSM